MRSKGRTVLFGGIKLKTLAKSREVSECGQPAKVGIGLHSNNAVYLALPGVGCGARASPSEP